MATQMLVPSQSGGVIVTAASGTNYTSDNYGVINVSSGDVPSCIAGGCTFVTGTQKNNFTATTNPTSSNDGTQDYAIGSRWLNVSLGIEFICSSAATGNAVWLQNVNTTATQTVYGVTISPAVFGFINSPITTATGTTLSAAALAAGYITRSGPTAAFTDTLDTAANVFTAFQAYGGLVPNVVSANVEIKNTTNYPMTINMGTGFTINGTINSSFVIPPNSQGFFFILPTSATTAVIYLGVTGNAGTGVSNYSSQAATNTTSFTVAASQITGGAFNYFNMQGALASAQVMTLPTAAQIIAAIPNCNVGFGYILSISNQSSGAFNWSVTNNTGVTVSGTNTIAQNTWREFTVNVVTTNTVTFTSQRTGTFS